MKAHISTMNFGKKNKCLEPMGELSGKKERKKIIRFHPPKSKP